MWTKEGKRYCTNLLRLVLFRLKEMRRMQIGQITVRNKFFNLFSFYGAINVQCTRNSNLCPLLRRNTIANQHRIAYREFNIFRKICISVYTVEPLQFNSEYFISRGSWSLFKVVTVSNENSAILKMIPQVYNSNTEKMFCSDIISVPYLCLQVTLIVDANSDYVCQNIGCI